MTVLPLDELIRLGQLPRIIGICGPDGAGKSTAALTLVEKGLAHRMPFARPLKAALEAMGVPTWALYGTPEQKALPLEDFGNRSGRDLMRDIGLWGRAQYEDFWVDRWKQRALRAAQTGRVVVDDVRFENEVEAILKLGGVVVRIIQSPDQMKPAPNAHASERHDLLEAHVTLLNDASIDKLASDFLTLFISKDTLSVARAAAAALDKAAAEAMSK